MPDAFKFELVSPERLLVSGDVEQVLVPGAEVFEVVGGQVVEHWVVLDQLGMLQQLGMVPTPGQGG